MLYDPFAAFHLNLGDHHYLHMRALESLLCKLQHGDLNPTAECPDTHPDEVLHVSPGQPDSTHIVCFNGTHFRVGARVVGFQPIASYGMITQGFIEEMGPCDECACAQATTLPIDWMWQYNPALLRHIGALVPVPKDKVLYRTSAFESGRNTGTQVAFHDAGMLVLPSLLRTWSLLENGGEIKTEEDTWYRYARNVTTKYVYRNTGGVMEKCYVTGG